MIEALKAAFVHGRLTKDEFDTRVGQALSARTYADLSALTADIPAAHVDPAAPGPCAGADGAGAGGAPTTSQGGRWVGRLPGHRVRRPCRRGALRSGGAGPDPQHYMAAPFILLGFLAVFGALGILVVGVAASVNQRRSRRQPPPGPGGRALDGERPEGTGRLVPPGRPADKTKPTCALTSRRSADGPFPPRRAGHRVAPRQRLARSDCE